MPKCNNCKAPTDRKFPLWDLYSCSERCDKGIDDDIELGSAFIGPDPSTPIDPAVIVEVRAEYKTRYADRVAAHEIPRRICLDRMTPAERTITDAMAAVERLPPDARLTEAVILLAQARDKVADFVDALETSLRENVAEAAKTARAWSVTDGDGLDD